MPGAASALQDQEALACCVFVPLTAVDSWVAVLVVGVGLTDCSFQCMRIVPQSNECSTANAHRSMVCASIKQFVREQQTVFTPAVAF